MTTKTKSPNHLLIILILGALTTIGPISIDMYLPAFPQIAKDFNTSVSQVALSLSSYFVGLSLAQIFYGPILDRFGRKKPIAWGLGLYILASIACLRSHSVEALVAFRFLQALGGCGAQVGAMAMVKDFFPARESAKIFSLLILILGVSPLLAPTAGGFVAQAWGWHGVFLVLLAIVFIIILVMHFFLPEGHQPDPSISLRPKPIFDTFKSIFKNAQFSTFSFAGAFSFAGLFVYVAGSPIIFMDVFHVTASQYGAIFAILSVGFIGSSQLNIYFSRKFRSERIFQIALTAQCLISLIFLVGSLNNWFSLFPTLVVFFCYLSCVGIGSPNATALALAPFSKIAGSASALVGFLQMGIGAVASAGIGIFEVHSTLPMASLLAGTSCVGMGILLFGKRRIVDEIEVTEVGAVHI